MVTGFPVLPISLLFMQSPFLSVKVAYPETPAAVKRQRGYLDKKYRHVADSWPLFLEGCDASAYDLSVRSWLTAIDASTYKARDSRWASPRCQ
jgi:hypothetical protein